MKILQFYCSSTPIPDNDVCVLKCVLYIHIYVCYVLHIYFLYIHTHIYQQLIKKGHDFEREQGGIHIGGKGSVCVNNVIIL